jgi:hypothetical protein
MTQSFFGVWIEYAIIPAVNGPGRIMTTTYFETTDAIPEPSRIHHPKLIVARTARSKRDTLAVGRPARPCVAKGIRSEIALVRTIRCA